MGHILAEGEAAKRQLCDPVKEERDRRIQLRIYFKLNWMERTARIVGRRPLRFMLHSIDFAAYRRTSKQY
jgi:hypothetical protein